MRVRWGGDAISPGSQSRALLSMGRGGGEDERGKRKKISLIQSVSPQRSEGIAGVKPDETDSSPARRSRAEIKNAPVIQTFTGETTENSFVPPPPQEGPALPRRQQQKTPVCG